MKNSSEKNLVDDIGASRLDVYLVEKGIVSSRSRAQKIIDQGFVNVDGQIIKKHNKKITENSVVSVKNFDLYVGRGGEKLAGALQDFNVNPKNLICLDVGSSTGGFSEVLLRGDAKKIYAIDVGTDQFDKTLAENPKIVLMESTDIRDVFRLPEKIDLCVIDVSFIPLENILPSVFNLMKKDGIILALVKPQFEVGKENIKKGIVKNLHASLQALNNVKDFVIKNGHNVLEGGECVISGKKGNQEYFLKIKT